MRTAELITGGALVLLAVVALQDTFKTSGWGSSGPDSGWYPFWSAAVMGAAALIALAGVATGRVGGPVFSSREGIGALARVTLPMIAVALAIPWLGFYVTTGVYMGGFARWQGGYKWFWVAVIAVSLPVALYLCFEQGFRVPLPKSVLYLYGMLSF